MRVVKLNQVSKSFRRVPVLSSVDLELRAGEIVALTGPNGSGKSVILQLACGLMRPDAGHVEIDPQFLPRGRTLPDGFGVVINGPAFLPQYSAFRNLQELASIRRVATSGDIQAALDRVGLDAGRTRARNFSLGMKQKLALAQALFEHPDVLILDEPFNALDEASVARVRRIFVEERARGTAILFTSHHGSDIEALVDRSYRLDGGRVLCSDESTTRCA